MSGSPELSIRQMASALRAGKTTSEMLTRAALGRIRAMDIDIHAFTNLDASGAMEAARNADMARGESADLPLLHGIAVAIKDVYDVAGLPTTCQSWLSLDYVPEDDSTPVRRLRDAGAIILGKLATHEFAIGAPSPDLPFPAARNPWDLAHIPGGSSSGSGAAIAAGFTRLALGTCTGGSILIPAAWCGAVGLKPTYGRVSKHGVFPLAWTLDHCGPLSRSVEDAAIALQVLAGHDPLDPASSTEPVDDYCTGLEQGVKGLTIGVPQDHFQSSPQASPTFLSAFDRTAALLAEAGARPVHVSLPHSQQFLAAGRVILSAEMFTIHAQDLRSRPLDYGELTAARLLLGATVSSEDYLNALRVRRMLAACVDAALDRCDVLLTAITLDTAPRVDPMPHFRHWPVQTHAFNVTGHPAVSVPVGLSPQGLPLAVQVVGRYFDEARILQVARAIERLTGWENQLLPDGT
ncbi:MULTISPECIES: amidase [Delftia]|jgi:aspartyl-tRNA(Asn)/glutamyl-tRNA(Gln) amidotransferase subunit A|uniref:amidase n=1 Tax=Delftia TaxID=80865 RepID=UPI00193B3CF1|nr:MULTISPECIES: amidase [Delftia]MCO5340330.1 amidase [Delftia tsuruhatensis]MCR4545597.1 amidase [Delftia tsuruhatensis]QRI90755.1 amidase [Delftia lacustris]